MSVELAAVSPSREVTSSAPTGIAFDRTEIESSIGRRFEKVARAIPERPAVRESGRVTSYGELDALANRAALVVSDRIAGAGRPVALLLEPGVPLFAAMLGTLKAGRFYAPLDPRLPPARLAAIASRLDAAVLVADASSWDLARSLDAGGAPLSRIEEFIEGPPPSDAAATVSPDDLAYVLFTSGSTGAPKGVMQSHRNLLHNVRALSAALGLGPEDRISLLSSPSFGASVSDIWGALLTGGCLCPYALSGDGLRRLRRFLEREAITVYHSVPGVFRSFSATLDGSEDLSTLRAVRLGGESVLAFDFDLFRNRFPRSCRFYVSLGSTETMVIRLWSAGHDTPWPGGTPLGHALGDAEVVLLDDEGRPARDEGEIGVVARTLAPGYWKDPDGTEAAFRPVPGRPGFRLHRTGDVGRLLPDGCLVHLGRRDARIKIRGHRVEIGEVEAALQATPGVVEAAAGASGGPSGARLVAWVVRRSPQPPTVGDLRRALSERLPAFMIPSSFVFVEALPRTVTGKLDRNALPDPGGARPPLSAPFVAPRDETEVAASSAFARVLDLDRVGVADDFFELGGDSLSAVELLAELSDVLGVELSVSDLLEAPTPAGLVERARRVGATAPWNLVCLRPGEGPPVFLVPGGAGDGKDLFGVRRLARHADGPFSFYGLRSGPGPHPPVGELAARCVEQMRAVAPRGPYLLVGDCVGGILAFAIARRLREDGEQVALLALLDTPFPAAARRVRGWLLARVPWAERVSARARYFLERARYHAGILRTLPRGRFGYALRIARVGTGGLAAPGGASRREALDRRASYVGRLLAWVPGPYDGAIHFVESDEARRRGFRRSWSRLAARGQVARIPGDHASLFVEHGEKVAAELSRWLAAATG